MAGNGWKNVVYQVIAEDDCLLALSSEERLLFLTVALAERRGSLLTENLEGLRAAFREVKQAHPFEMEASVILSDHLHCSWTLPEDDDDFSIRWRQIKAALSHRLPKIERRSESCLNKGERGIWRRRFWEHAGTG
jgi:putative transposase